MPASRLIYSGNSHPLFHFDPIAFMLPTESVVRDLISTGEVLRNSTKRPAMMDHHYTAGWHFYAISSVAFRRPLLCSFSVYAYEIEFSSKTKVNVLDRTQHFEH